MQQQKQVSSMGEGGIAAANVAGARSGGGGGGGGAAAGGVGGSGSVSVCRPSGSRWTPTPEQLRILKELYYGCGVRSPTAEQIQRITGMLRQHGKIEGKNVFYWFQNHKARERQKKRLTTNLDVVNAPAAGADVNHVGGVLSLSSPSSGATSPPSCSTLGMYSGNGGASAAMLLDTSTDWDNTAMATEGCFQLQDYMGVRGTPGGGHGSTGMATSSPWTWFSSSDQRTTTTRAPETLPLFPTTGDDNRPRPRQGGPPTGGDASYYLPEPDFSFWGAAPAATAATTTTTVTTIQQLQMQQQYSFYSNNNNQLPGHETTQDDTGEEGASLELSLSSWCSPSYHAGTM